MSEQFKRRSISAINVVSVLLAMLTFSPSVRAVDWTIPYAEPQDALAAQAETDEYAWRLFVALNWPADIPQRQSDSAKKFGADGPVAWETWKNAREVYLAKGADPGAWLGGPTPIANLMMDRFEILPLQQQIRLRKLEKMGLKPLFDPIAAANSINETRLNKVAFEFVRANEFYNLDGQLRAFDQGAEISFPKAAKEIKAQWRKIDAKDRQKYHSVEVASANGTKTLYGLTALHITTKDLPNWLWATFEHVENQKIPGNEQWQLSSVDRFACKGLPADCGKSPSGIGLEGTKWENYRLRGAQIDFIDGRGNPTLLANSQPESGFQTSSSCITCHSRSTVGRINSQPARLSIFDSSLDTIKTGDAPIQGHVGPAKAEWFWSDSLEGRKRLYLQLDFVWSLFRAQPKGN